MINKNEMDDLECKIFCFIEDHYNTKFKGKVKVHRDKEEWCLILTLNNWMTPMYICTQLTNEDDFYNFIVKELKRRNLIQVDYSKLVLENGENYS